jgi:hypothetical protein
MLSRRVQHQNIGLEHWPTTTGIKHAARERQAAAYLLDICTGLLQFYRDFLSLFISMAKPFLTGHCRSATAVPAFQVLVLAVVLVL